MCEGSFVREMLEESLVESGIDIVASSADFRSLPPDQDVDVGVYVEPPGDGSRLASDLDTVDTSGVDRWLVLESSEGGQAFNQMSGRMDRVSVAPLEISRSAVGSAIGLAAQKHNLCVDKMCRGCPNGARRALDTLELCEDDWAILKCLANGESNKSIARTFACAESRVKAQLRRLMKLTSATNRT
ncbi:MAG: LuxR C-terminal-related transcriptional regulator, partial [Pontixanthobacter sp.]